MSKKVKKIFDELVELHSNVKDAKSLMLFRSKLLEHFETLKKIRKSVKYYQHPSIDWILADWTYSEKNIKELNLDKKVVDSTVNLMNWYSSSWCFYDYYKLDDEIKTNANQ